VVNDPPVQQPFSWRLFWVLFIAALLGVAGMVPMALELFEPMLREAQLPPIPLPLLILIGLVQNLTLLGLFVGLGLLFSAKLGLGPGLTRSWLNGSLTSDQVWSAAKHGILWGLAVSAVLLPTIILLSTMISGLPFVSAAKIAIWKRFLACFYGGLYEEIFTRLFLLSLFAWVINRSWRTPRPTLNPKVFWIANFLVAILFGLGHLPSASMMMTITPLVVAAALFLNGIAALVFGWLYWKRGLESAIFAHFTADIALWVIGPMFLKT
jgi:membrane protease YdiL (CAAX protease family)